MKRTPQELKALFVAGRIPTAQDFVDLIDSFLAVDQSNFPNPLPAVSGQYLTHILASDASTINVAEFNSIDGIPIYQSAHSFNISGNRTSLFPAYRRIKLLNSGGSATFTVEVSNFNSGTNQTTVNVVEEIDFTAITGCQIATVNPSNAGGSVVAQAVGLGRGSDLVSASTLDIGNYDSSFDVTGTVTIEEISNRLVGTVIRLYFKSALVLKNSSVLKLKNNQDFDVDAGDIFLFEKIPSGWRQVGSFTSTGDAPVGSVVLGASANTPKGHLPFSSTPISRIRYSKLFAEIGTVYGSGDGTTTFNIPDGRGLHPRFLDNGKGIDADRALGSYQEDQIKSHHHDLPTAGGTSGDSYEVSNTRFGSYDYFPTAPTSDTGGSENRVKTIAFPGFIKYQ